ncbi:PilN domain-containing protein [Kangiella koreensis]|uniref:Fimbrial assembly family protein n=1 Tax=Kangiella koreensis (strain DSM 16069 / JCM 12317 / KCTC 12182 / SW-125) TaxID=523791 RepID=C7R7X0_KANKD|nr:PilN domain-containing protein [Kangiella koreensis]ACV27653.1 Fimbrial assembly family protein [Kangiella koreensis DSM 16069]
MARINLLDWREELRQERQKEFFITLFLMAILAGMIWFLVNTVMSSRIDNQQVRNDFLETELRQLDRQIQEINKLEKQREELIKRMDLIQGLQQSRPEVVRMFDELVHVVPEGINLTSWERKGINLTFTGQAETNPRISEFMRKMDAAERLDTKSLRDVNKENKGIPAQIFVLEAEQQTPGLENNGQQEGGQ